MLNDVLKSTRWKPMCSSPVFSCQWIPTSLQIVQMAALVLVPSWRLIRNDDTR